MSRDSLRVSPAPTWSQKSTIFRSSGLPGRKGRRAAPGPIVFGAAGARRAAGAAPGRFRSVASVLSRACRSGGGTGAAPVPGRRHVSCRTFLPRFLGHRGQAEGRRRGRDAGAAAEVGLGGHQRGVGVAGRASGGRHGAEQRQVVENHRPAAFAAPDVGGQAPDRDVDQMQPVGAQHMLMAVLLADLGQAAVALAARGLGCGHPAGPGVARPRRHAACRSRPAPPRSTPSRGPSPRPVRRRLRRSAPGRAGRQRCRVRGGRRPPRGPAGSPAHRVPRRPRRCRSH